MPGNGSPRPLARRLSFAPICQQRPQQVVGNEHDEAAALPGERQGLFPESPCGRARRHSQAALPGPSSLDERNGTKRADARWAAARSDRSTSSGPGNNRQGPATDPRRQGPATDSRRLPGPALLRGRRPGSRKSSGTNRARRRKDCFRFPSDDRARQHLSGRLPGPFLAAATPKEKAGRGVSTTGLEKSQSHLGTTG